MAAWLSPARSHFGSLVAQCVTLLCEKLHKRTRQFAHQHILHRDPAALAGERHSNESKVNPSVDPSELLAAQRSLRDRILSGQVAGEKRNNRDLAAEMLLYLDEPQFCWAICARWLMTVTGADRMDAGFSNAQAACYRPTFELVRVDVVLPRVLGAAMDARDPGIAGVWEATRVVVFNDVQGDRRLGSSMRAALLAAGTRRKLAVALRDDGRDVGLLCVDAVSAAQPWRADECERLDSVARDVISPILAVARRFAVENGRVATDFGLARNAGECGALTPAELRVGRLVLAGCSYKEIARRLDRSASTIDHQLRSMREKLGVTSTAKLMRDLMALIPTTVPAAPEPPAAPDSGHH